MSKDLNHKKQKLFSIVTYFKNIIQLKTIVLKIK